MASDYKSFLLCQADLKKGHAFHKWTTFGQELFFSHLVDVQLWTVKHAVFVHGRDCEESSADTS